MLIVFKRYTIPYNHYSPAIIGKVINKYAFDKQTPVMYPSVMFDILNIKIQLHFVGHDIPIRFYNSKVLSKIRVHTLCVNVFLKRVYFFKEYL